MFSVFPSSLRLSLLSAFIVFARVPNVSSNRFIPVIEVSFVQNPCWLMMIGYYTSQYIGNIGDYHKACGESLLTNQYQGKPWETILFVCLFACCLFVSINSLTTGLSCNCPSPQYCNFSEVKVQELQREAQARTWLGEELLRCNFCRPKNQFSAQDSKALVEVSCF